MNKTDDLSWMRTSESLELTLLFKGLGSGRFLSLFLFNEINTFIRQELGLGDMTKILHHDMNHLIS